jgi:hypothetical protein
LDFESLATLGDLIVEKRNDLLARRGLQRVGIAARDCVQQFVGQVRLETQVLGINERTNEQNNK